MYQHNHYPDQDQAPQVTDEEFLELTHGLSKDDMFGLLVDMRQAGSGSIHVDGDNVILRAQNLENGPMFPVLEVTSSDTKTTIRGFGGDKCAISVEPLSKYLEDIGKVDAAVKIGKGKQLQDKSDFALVPASHWKAMGEASKFITDLKQQKANERAQKRGGLVHRLIRR